MLSIFQESGFVCILLLVIALQSVAKAAFSPENLLLPKPRKVKWLPGSLLLSGDVAIVMSDSANKTTASTAHLLADDFQEATGLKAHVKSGSTGANSLNISLRVGRRRGVAADRYSLKIQPAGVEIDGAGESGLFYGTRTLLQLASGQASGGALPCCHIQDWPDYQYRMVHYDLAREQTANIPYLKLMIYRLSNHKINMLKLYFENRFKFHRHPLISPAGVMTADQAKELNEYARARFVELVPEVNTLGHMEHALAVPEYRHLAEDQNEPYELCATSAEGKRLVSDLIVEMSNAFSSRFLHVGGDETGQTGTCPTCSKEAEAIGKSGLYVNHFLAVHDMVKSRGKRMMMWGDMLLAHREVVDLLPKDIIIFDWHYADSSASTVEFFRRKGFEVFACPAMSGFGRIAAPYLHATNNIHTFIGQGVEAGAVGECTCAWELKMGHLFENDYFGIILSADRAWNLSCDIDDFKQRFCKSFFGLNDTRAMDCYSMVSDGFIQLCGDAFGEQCNHALLHLHGPDEIVESYGDNMTSELLDKALLHQKNTLDLIESVKRDCTRNCDSLDFLDLPTYGWVHAIKRTLFYKQVNEHINAARDEAVTDPQSANERLSKAESLLDQILADLPYFERRFSEAVERFGGSVVDLERIAGNRARLEERKAEIAGLRENILRK